MLDRPTAEVRKIVLDLRSAVLDPGAMVHREENETRLAHVDRAVLWVLEARGLVKPAAERGEDRELLLTADEHEAVDLLGRLVHLLADIVGPDMTRRADMTEAYYHVHALQNMILAQAAARAYPDRYRLLGRTVSDGAAAALSEPPVWAQATVRAMQTELEHLARVRGGRT